VVDKENESITQHASMDGSMEEDNNLASRMDVVENICERREKVGARASIEQKEGRTDGTRKINEKDDRNLGLVTTIKEMQQYNKTGNTQIHTTHKSTCFIWCAIVD